MENVKEEKDVNFTSASKSGSSRNANRAKTGGVSQLEKVNEYYNEDENSSKNEDM